MAKRFAFTLECVLGFKQKQEKLAEADQRRAMAALQEIQDEARRIRDEMTQIADSLSEKMHDAVDLTLCVAFNRKSTQLEARLRETKKKELAATVKLQEANARRKKIAVEVEALLTLKREQWQAYRRAADRKTQEQLDDLGLRRWLGKVQAR